VTVIGRFARRDISLRDVIAAEWAIDGARRANLLSRAFWSDTGAASSSNGWPPSRCSKWAPSSCFSSPSAA